MLLMLARQARGLSFFAFWGTALFACSSPTSGQTAAAGSQAGSPSSAGAAGTAMNEAPLGGSSGSTTTTAGGGELGVGGGSTGFAGMGGSIAGGGGMPGAGGFAGATGSAGSMGAAGSGMTPAGQYSVTLDATTPYALGAEHVGHTVFGTVIDTTTGANRVRVGRIQETPIVPGQQVKWVWPKIMVAGHTYELAMFGDDYSKNRTCVVASGTPNPGWIMKIPAPTADFEFLWKRPVTRSDGPECVDFPNGAIPTP